MKHIKDIYEALLDGNKIRRDIWEGGLYIHLDLNGNLKNEGNVDSVWAFNPPSEWSIYKAPKAKLMFYGFMFKKDFGWQPRRTIDITELKKRIEAHSELYMRDESLDREF